MIESSNPLQFEAMLPRLGTPIRIGCFQDALVFVRRWTIRDKDLEVRDLLRRMQRANSSRDVHSLVGELRQKLAKSGLLPQNPLR
jgi:hypothetical protein